MSNLRTQKRIAAEVLRIGKDRVWINPGASVDVSQAMTREDVRNIIEQGLIQEKPEKKQTRERAKKRDELKKKRKGVGQGKRRGKSNSRTTKKEKWMIKVRSQRKFLRYLKEKGAIAEGEYRKYYLRIKGGVYTTLKQMKESMKTDGVLK